MADKPARNVTFVGALVALAAVIALPTVIDDALGITRLSAVVGLTLVVVALTGAGVLAVRRPQPRWTVPYAGAAAAGFVAGVAVLLLGAGTEPPVVEGVGVPVGTARATSSLPPTVDPTSTNAAPAHTGPAPVRTGGDCADLGELAVGQPVELRQYGHIAIGDVDDIRYKTAEPTKECGGTISYDPAYAQVNFFGSALMKNRPGAFSQCTTDNPVPSYRIGKENAGWYLCGPDGNGHTVVVLIKYTARLGTSITLVVVGFV